MSSPIITGWLCCLLLLLTLNIVVYAEQSPPSSSADDQLQQTTRWGFDDRVAIAGRLFEYRLNDKDFSGSVSKVTEIGSEVLPSWLHFSSDSSSLEGVPSASDIGKTYQIQVVATDSGRDQTEVDTFEIEIVKDLTAASADVVSSPSGESKIPNPIRCLPGSAVTTATVILDANMDSMSGQQRAALVRAICSHLELPVDGIRVTETSGKIPNDDGSALVAGAGNVPRLDDGHPQILVQWEVGCGNVFAAHMAILQHVETTAIDGSMANAVGHGVIGWHVANKRPPSPTRLRRQAARIFPTPTPGLAVTPPTSKPVPTATIKVPEPTAAVPSTTVARPRTQKPVKTTTPKPTKPTKTTREKVVRTTTTKAASRTTTLKSTAPPTTTKSAIKLVPSVGTVPAVDVAHSPTPPLHVRTTADSEDVELTPLAWTGSLSSLEFSVNEIVNREVPAYAFTGSSVASATYQLLSPNRLEATPDWFEFDKVSKRFVGMPLENHVGQKEYVLEATDSSGNMASGQFIVKVVPQLQTDVHTAYEANATFKMKYSDFIDNGTLRMQMVKKIASAFGDVNTSRLSVLRVAPGSVVVAWTNTSSSMAADERCPRGELAWIRSRLFNSDGSVSENFRQSLRPYEVTSVAMTSRNACGTESITSISGSSPPRIYTDAPVLTDPSSSIPETGAKSASSFNSTVLIVVLIVVGGIILVLVTIYLCCRRRRSKKSGSPDKKIKSGAPIILQYELDDAGSNAPPSKPLVGSGAEKPPAPPNYHVATGAPGNGMTPPLTDHRRPLLSDTGAEQMSPLKYQPPPGSATRGQQPAGQRR